MGNHRVASVGPRAGKLSQYATEATASQPATLGQQVAALVQALETERDQTAGIAPLKQTSSPPSGAYRATGVAAARVQALAAGINGSYPANIQARVATVVADLNDLPGLRITAQARQSALAVIGAYG